MKRSVQIYLAAAFCFLMAGVFNTNEICAQPRGNSGRSGQNSSREQQTLNPRQQSQMEKRQQKVNTQQMPSNISRQPETNRQVEQARQENRLDVPYRPERENRDGRPQMAPAQILTPVQMHARTNASRVIVYTDFSTRADAYLYVSDLIADRYYDIDTYDTSYGWFRTSLTMIPTPSGWADPYSQNQFRIRFDFDRYRGGIRIVITAQWRESRISGQFYDLRYQSSDRYSTYYAWNILEDIANSIPNYGIDFQ